jgi:hypothetical protein
MACNARTLFSAAAVAAALLALGTGPAGAETTTVYGTVASILSAHPGAFLPANSDRVCFSMNGSKCWDGKKWIELVPAGPRRFTIATTDKVACAIIVEPNNDCWTGTTWYRLPSGQLFGVIGGVFSIMPGAFITAPLHSRPATFISAPARLPLDRVATQR